MNLFQYCFQRIRFNYLYRNSQKLFLNGIHNSGVRCHSEPVQMAYSVYEEKQQKTVDVPIIVMHGLFGSKQNWKSLSKAMNARSNPTRKVIAVDARNHGESPRSLNHSYEDLAEDVAELCRQQNISKSIVIGHSMGGRAMMCFALNYPELVEKAIIVDISPIPRSKSSTTMSNIYKCFEAMRDINLPSDLTMSAGRVAANEKLKQAVPHKATRDFVLMNLLKKSDGSFDWRVSVEALYKNFQDHMAMFPDSMAHKQYNGSVILYLSIYHF